MEIRHASSGLSLLMSAYSAPSSPESCDLSDPERSADNGEPNNSYVSSHNSEQENGEEEVFQEQETDENEVGTVLEELDELQEQPSAANSSIEQEYTEDMFESYDGVTDTVPSSGNKSKSSHHRHSIYSVKSVEKRDEARQTTTAAPTPLQEDLMVEGDKLVEYEDDTADDSGLEEEPSVSFQDEQLPAVSDENMELSEQDLSQDLSQDLLDAEIMYINKENIDANESSVATMTVINNKVDELMQDGSISSYSQDSEKYGLRRHDSNLSSALSTTPIIKEEILEYTDGKGQYFYVPPSDDDIYKSECPTYLPEQEFTSLSEELKSGTVWNKDDAVFSSILHNLGLVHRDAAARITKLSSIQKSKLAMLIKNWSDQKAFTDCLVEMTDCDHFYNPIGYDTVLVTDPCMSAKYDFLTDGLNEQEVERKQLDEFYNFTEEKSFFFQKCKICSKLYSNSFGLRQHIAHMHPNVNIEELLKKDDGIYSCLKCKKAFNCQAQLKKHFKKNHIPKSTVSDPNFKCSHCGEYFKTRVLLHRHTSDKHRNRSKTEVAELHEPWSCEMCKSIFYKKTNFLKHMQKIHGKQKVSERLLNSAKLSAQLVMPKPPKPDFKSGSPKPTSARPREPPKEKKGSKSVKRLELAEDMPESSPETNHVESLENADPVTETSPTKSIKESEVNVTCLFCKLCFVSYTDLQFHCSDVHRGANKIILLKMFTIIGSQPHGINFQCILCTKISATPPVALGHLESVHLSEQPDSVAHSETKERTDNNMSYISPQLADFDGLSLICRFCQKSFKNSKIKRKHEKSVHNDQTIVCFYCFIPILNRTELTKHIKSEHSGSKSLFKCRWCDAHFTSIPKRCSHMKEFHSSDVANISNKPQGLPQPVSVTPEKLVNKEEKDADWFCDRCKISFPSVDLKSKHDRYIHNEVDLNCLYCFTPFKNKESLIQHIAVYHSAYHLKKPYKCKWCEITFETLYQRSLHMKHCHGVPSSAPFNENVTPTFEEPQDPLPRFTSVNKTLSFSEESTPTSIFAKETSKLVRNCLFCDAEVTSMILKKHLIEHRQWDHFCCIFCDKTVPTIGGIKSHILRNHPFITSRKMDRSELESGEAERIANIEKYHKSDSSSRRPKIVACEPPPPRISPETEIIFPCQICFFLFSINHHVEEHWKEHSDALLEEWTCTLCDEQYGEFESFKFHVGMHQSDAFLFAQSTVDLQNICGYCNITVDTQQALDGHILIHRSVQQFNCIFCKAKSLTFRDIKEHISQNHVNTSALSNDPSRHLNETPFNSSTFKCAICLKLCNNQFNLNSHTKAHILGGKPCALCKFKFKDMATLKRHLLLVHGAPEEYIASIESNAVSRSDAVADYCELCDKTFSSQGKFQKHRKACRDRYRLQNTASLDNSTVFSLLDSGSDRSRQNSEKQPTDLGQTIVPEHSEPATPSYYDNDSENDSTGNIAQNSMDELDSLPMEIPMKSTNDDGMFTVTTSPHSYNTRKRPRPESYANIIPAKMLSMSYSASQKDAKAASPPAKVAAFEPISPTVSTPVTAGTVPGPISPVIARPPDQTPPVVSKKAPVPMQSPTPGAAQPPSAPSTPPETTYCEICELHFASNKQLYWHKHTKRHLAMEILSKGPTAVSHGKHLCDQCDQGYNCKKQLHWHKKITHDQRTNLAEIILRQPQHRANTAAIPHPSSKTEHTLNPDRATLASLATLTSVAPNQLNHALTSAAANQMSGAALASLASALAPITPPKIPCVECDEKFDDRSTLDDHYLIMHGPGAPVIPSALPKGPGENASTSESPLPKSAPEIEDRLEPTTAMQNEEGLEDTEVQGNKDLQSIKSENKVELEVGESENGSQSHDSINNGSSSNAGESTPTDMDTTEPPKFYCSLCKLSYKTNKQLYNHKRTLSHIQLAKKLDPSYTETYYTCDECQIDFQSYKQLWNHKKSLQHKELAEKILLNPPTDSMKSDASETDHQRRKNFVCLDCDCVFEDKKQMKWHRKTWSHKTITIVPPPNEKQEAEEPAPAREPRLPSKCSRGLICTTANPCRHHGVMKTVSAPYTCQECKLPFRALRAYTVHCKQHLKEGFKCTLCNQKFQFKNYNNVKRHLTNIHKISGDRTKNYLETFHNFDENAQPLRSVNPADLQGGAPAEAGEGEARSPSNSEPRSPSFIEGLLDAVGLSLEIVERKPEWIESAKCKFCKLDFENVPEMLLHVQEEHDRNYHKEFLANFIDLELEESSSDEELETDSDDTGYDDEEVAETKDRHHSLSDVELETAGEEESTALPPIRIKRPGESLTSCPVKKQKLGFGSKTSSIDAEKVESSTSSSSLPDEMFGESVHGPKRQYACILCNTGFTVYLAWWYHSKLEHDFSNVAYYGGSAASKLPVNYESSSKKNVHAECPECHVIFNQRLLLEDHLKVHRKPKIFQCDFCCKQFNSCKNASRHRLKCHCIVVKGRKCYMCKSCDKHFPRGEELIEHVQTQHESAPATFCCATCGKVYNKESTFVSHIRECDPESNPGPAVPGPANPDPEVAKPDLEVASPDSEVAKPDPEVASPDPEVANPSPEVANPSPEVVNPDPEAEVSNTGPCVDEVLKT